LIKIHDQDTTRSQNIHRQQTGGMTESITTTSRQESGQKQTIISPDMSAEPKESIHSPADDKRVKEFAEDIVSNTQGNIDDILFADDDSNVGENSQTLADDYSRYPRRPTEATERHNRQNVQRADDRYVEQRQQRPVNNTTRNVYQQQNLLPDIEFCSIPCYEDFLVMFSSAPGENNLIYHLGILRWAYLIKILNYVKVGVFRNTVCMDKLL